MKKSFDCRIRYTDRPPGGDRCGRPWCGHAIQHQEGYAPLKARSFSVPLANIGSRLLADRARSCSAMVPPIGILLFVFVVAFQLITLRWNSFSPAMTGSSNQNSSLAIRNYGVRKSPDSR
ncbi:MAG: zinc metallopeptidase [Blautia coccoides]